jgi:hypothetical protein
MLTKLGLKFDFSKLTTKFLPKQSLIPVASQNPTSFRESILSDRFEKSGL